MTFKAVHELPAPWLPLRLGFLLLSSLFSASLWPPCFPSCTPGTLQNRLRTDWNAVPLDAHGTCPLVSVRSFSFITFSGGILCHPSEEILILSPTLTPHLPSPTFFILLNIYCPNTVWFSLTIMIITCSCHANSVRGGICVCFIYCYIYSNAWHRTSSH